MNEDLKAKLKEKFGAVVSEEQLDKVAGGSNGQNYEILNAMQKIDPQAVMDITAQANQIQRTGDAEEDMRVAMNIIADGAKDLLQKHFGNEISYVSTQKWHSNQYDSANGKPLTHKQVMQMINYKIELATWEIVN